ncbi:LamG domain-containing protein [Mucilaginibacter sp. dw_454]|uniref:LamG domain-containing protein n=1 Tax=Mucilaginibacter sp. dw_454 TaxID=2720079 RepID=UPI001BD1F692|nr:LamG domain-containing protein [Mucilaginibacter sp. dw_454]
MKKKSVMGVALFAAASISFIACKKNSAPGTASGIVTPNTVSTSFAPLATLSNGLLAYWPGVSNTGYDFSGNGHTATLSTISPAVDHSGHTNGASGFNGTSSFMSVPDNVPFRLSGTDYTINAWVNLTSYNAGFGSVIAGKRSSTPNDGWSFGITGALASPGGSGFVNFNPGTTPYGEGFTHVNTGGWHMVTSVYSNTAHTTDTYVDGVHYIPTTPSVNTPVATNANTFYLGKDDPTLGGSFLNGALDNVRLYNRTVSATEVSALYASTTPPTNDVVAYWPLTQSTNDFSGNGNNGTATAITTTTDRFGNPVGAYAFNGTTSSIVVPDATDLRLANSSFTLNAWINLHALSTSASIIMGKRNFGIGNSGWSWGITSTGLVNFSNGVANTSSSTAISTNAWHMVTITYDSAVSRRLSVYIDNVLSNSVINVAAPAALVFASLYIGQDNPAGTYFFNGAMSDLRIYNFAFQASDVSNLYNALN